MIGIFLPLFSLLDVALLLLRAEKKEAAAFEQQQNIKNRLESIPRPQKSGISLFRQ